MLVKQRLLLLTFLFLACTREYGIAVRNMTPNVITDARVTFDGFKSIGGVLDPGIYAVTYETARPIPSSAKVEWRTHDGELHSSVVLLDVPPGFAGRLFFEIMPDHTVRVRAREKLPPITTNPEEP
mgnify:CR=1 FL=1